MLYKNRKAIVRLPNSDADFFDIFTGVLLRDTSAPFLPRLCTSEAERDNIKLFFTKTGKKHMVSCRNNNRRRQQIHLPKLNNNCIL